MAVLFRSKNQTLAKEATAILKQEHPMTMRQLYYRCASAGLIQPNDTDKRRLGNIMTRLREAESVPRTWIVDHIRTTLKPSSWTGLDDFGDTVRECYRKDFWASLDHHVEVFIEKDAIAGTIQPVTQEFDVGIRVCRGYCSVSFAGEIADLWEQIEKPIFVYYLGDFDPSGFDLERDIQERLERYSKLPMVVADDPESYLSVVREEPKVFESRVVYWIRLAVLPEDFERHRLLPLPVKQKDTRSAGFLKKHGKRCAEVDALPPNELRRRVREAIEAHIDQKRWQKLLQVEKIEKEALAKVLKLDDLGWRAALE